MAALPVSGLEEIYGFSDNKKNGTPYHGLWKTVYAQQKSSWSFNLALGEHVAVLLFGGRLLSSAGHFPPNGCRGEAQTRNSSSSKSALHAVHNVCPAIVSHSDSASRPIRWIRDASRLQHGLVSPVQKRQMRTRIMSIHVRSVVLASCATADRVRPTQAPRSGKPRNVDDAALTSGQVSVCRSALGTRLMRAARALDAQTGTMAAQGLDRGEHMAKQGWQTGRRPIDGLPMGCHGFLGRRLISILMHLENRQYI